LLRLRNEVTMLRRATNELATLGAQNRRLRDELAVSKRADESSRQATPPPALFTRTYRVPTNQIAQKLMPSAQMPDGTALVEVLGRYFETNGVHTEAPASLHFDATNGLLLVCDTQTNIDRLEKLIEHLSR
jgi:hypothetical protein